MIRRIACALAGVAGLAALCLTAGAGTASAAVVSTAAHAIPLGGDWDDMQMCANISGDNDCIWVSPNGNHFLEAVAYNGGLSITSFSSEGAYMVQAGTNNCITFNGDGNDYIMTTCSNRVSQRFDFLYGSGPSPWALDDLYDHECIKYDGRNVAPTPTGCSSSNGDLFWDAVAR